MPGCNIFGMKTTGEVVAAFIASRRPGWTLERSFYVDAEIYAIDMERIYRQHWLLAGPSCRAREVGEWFTYQIGDDSIVFVRDETHCVRAFHNVCRHRGSRICLESDGRDKALVCPYHNWSYRLDGALAHARHLPREIDHGELALHAVETREVAGLIFVCLTDSPPPFDVTAADIADFFGPFQLEKTQVCRRTVETIRANWKVVAENFWECYHCQPTHPEFCSVMSYAHAQNNERLAEVRGAFEREWRERAKLRPGRIDSVAPGANGLPSRRPHAHSTWLSHAEPGWKARRAALGRAKGIRRRCHQLHALSADLVRRKQRSRSAH
jgi:phenylpropionate dioxygenase-like ring-hydroxylating dioxygenase large terminal subunit